MKVEIDSKPLLRALERLAKESTELFPVMDKIGRILLTSTRLNFKDQADPSGRKWAPLSPVTIARRRQGPRKGAAPMILQDNANLLKSLTFNATSGGVEVGTNTVYAPTHQFGAKRGAFGRTKRGAPIPWGNIPARPFLGISGEDEEEIISIIHDHLKQAAKG